MDGTKQALHLEQRQFSSIGRIQLRTVLFLRWIAVIGQTIAVCVAGFLLHYPLPLLPTAATILALALVTLFSQRSGRTSLNDAQSAVHFAFDIVQLAVLLFLTGGLTNPFAILMLAPVTVGAAVLSYSSTILLGLLAIFCSVILAFFHLPLPWPEAFLLPPLYLAVLALALIFATIFMVTYVFRVAEEARRLSNALHLVQTALEREQQLASLGALAAAAAHELGSPLGTIAIAAKELARSLPDAHPAKADADLLVKESMRCRDILTELAARPEHAGKDHLTQIPGRALIELASAPYRRAEIALVIQEESEDSPSLLPRQPEILHGLGNLLQNAMEMAHSQVTVSLSWKKDVLRIILEDDGPGFETDLLTRVGEPYLVTERTKENHMGLGIFIAKHLIERTGGKTHFANRPEGGAIIELTWPRSFFS